MLRELETPCIQSKMNGNKCNSFFDSRLSTSKFRNEKYTTFDKITPDAFMVEFGCEREIGNFDSNIEKITIYFFIKAIL